MMNLSPEERVRQALISLMIREKGFPKECIAIERSLSAMPHLKGAKLPNRRFDIVCFTNQVSKEEDFFPLLVIECKAIPLMREALSQIIGYNFHINAFAIALANGENILTGVKEREGGYSFSQDLPSYMELVTQAKGFYAKR